MFFFFRHKNVTIAIDYIRQNKLYRDLDNDFEIDPFATGYFVEMITRKKRSVYNMQFAMIGQSFESCQDIVRFVRRFIDSTITAAIKIITIMVR